jgi:phosphomannomutase
LSLMVSISGIRGIVGESLTPDTVIKYVSAYAQYCRRGHIIVGRDGRITGKNIDLIVTSTLLHMGCAVTSVGICPTPTVALAVAKLRAAGGISITASHNPMMWNGLKFFAPSGLFLDSRENEELWKIAALPSRPYASWEKQGEYAIRESFLDEHIEEVLGIPYIDREKVAKRKFKVVLDCINAAGGTIVPKLLEKFGCTVIPLNCDVSGVFSHMPEPVPENLGSLCAKVQEERADLGIAVDPDVDRLVLVDERGEPLGEEYTIAGCVKFTLGKDRSDSSRSVVVNLSTTRAVEDIARQYGAACIRTPVGEINVAKKMMEVNALIGGEGSGGVILPSVHLGRDALVGIGLMLQYLAEFGGAISDLKASLPQYCISKDKVALGTLDPDGILKRLQAKYAPEGAINTDDGLKIDFPESWIHLRKSNTEPIVRIIAEARTKEETDALVMNFTAEILSK